MCAGGGHPKEPEEVINEYSWGPGTLKLIRLLETVPFCSPGTQMQALTSKNKFKNRN